MNYTQPLFVELARLREQGDHAGFARLTLANIGLAGKKRALLILSAARRWYMARDMRQAKKTLGRVDPRGLAADERHRFDEIMLLVNHELRAKRHEVRMARSGRPVKVPTFLKAA